MEGLAHALRWSGFAPRARHDPLRTEGPGRWAWRILARLGLGLVGLALAGAVWSMPADPAGPRVLAVVTDDNYPPYVFRSADGAVEGYLIDLWHLWEKKTGVRVELVATDWARAQQLMQAGQADVIDTMFRTPEREKLYDFTPPYADIPVAIYVHADIGGIRNLETLRGFLVGVKAGDACIEQLTARGIANLQAFPSYDAIAQAAAAGDVRVFCLDEPPANFLLYRSGISKSFRKAFVVNTGQFHRAVRKGDSATLKLVEQGFLSIGPGEYRELRERWMGSDVGLIPLGRYLGYGLAAAVLVGVLLAAWSVTLQRRVRRQTADLAHRNLQLRTLLNTLPDLVWLKDPNGVYLACNAEFERYVGRPEAQIIGRTDFDLVPEDLAHCLRANDQEAVAAGRASANEEEVVHAGDGRHVLLETIRTPMFVEGGRLFGVLGIGRDMTERKRAADELAASEARLAATLEQSPNVVVQWFDGAGRILYWNSASERITGWRAEEALGKTLDQLALQTPEQCADFRRILGEIAASGQRFGPAEYTLRHRQGGLSYLEETVFAVPGRGGERIFVCMDVDITERKRAEALAIETQERFRVAFEASPLAASISTVDDGRFVDVNRRFVQEFGWSRDEIIGRTSFEIELWSDPGVRQPWLETMRRERTLIDQEAVWLDRQRRPRQVSVSVELIELQGQPYLLTFVSDIGARKRAEEELRQREAYNKVLFADSPIPHLVLDPQTLRIIDCNRAAVVVQGLSGREELLGAHPLDLSPAQQPDGTATAEALQQRVAAILDQGAQQFIWQFRRSNGELWDADVHVMPFAHDGSPLFQVSVQDVTARRRAEESLRLAARVFESTADGVSITDPEGNIIAVNRAFTEITGYTADEAIGRNPRILKSGRHDPDFYRAMWLSLQESGLWQGEIWNRRKNGNIYPEWLTLSVVKDDQGQASHYVAVFSDISAVRQSQEALDFLAHHDPLTALPNRLLFRDRLEHAMSLAHREQRRVAVLFVDLDRFKHINDTLGHNVGDELLCAVAEAMNQQLRASDTLARLGGDEFVILVEEDVTPASVGVVAARLMEIFARPVKVEGRELYVTGSIGISLFPNDGTDADTLLKHADLAMYRAKENGRNTFHFYEATMAVGAFERLAAENALRGAIGRGELRLHYQPQVHLASGALAGVEALVRWEHPELGLLAPDRFVGVAEEMGIIGEIGEWVLAEACRQLARWRQAGFAVPRMAVNLSMQQLERDELVACVRGLLETWALTPDLLELEVTESMIMRQTGRVLPVLDGLRSLGVYLAVDDFGTGYSSLSRLRHLPVHRLKVDYSFVRDIGRDADDETITRGVIALGRSLGLEVVAEGVERQEQVDFLLQEGCLIAQGYLFDAPLAPDALFRFWSGARPGQRPKRST